MLPFGAAAGDQHQALSHESKAFEVPRTAVHTIVSSASGRSYEIYIKTPVGYEDAANSKVKYPVIYLNDGPYTFQVASGLTHLPMGNSRKFERAILVGISYAEGEAGMASRVRDFTPVRDASWTRYETGGAPQYLAFLEQQVFPFVETHFRADPTRRTLSGQSLGGSFGAWVLLERPELFSNYILTSPSLWFHDRYIFDLEQSRAGEWNDLDAHVYFAVGEMETVDNGMTNPMVSQLVEFGDRLRSRGYPNLKLQVEVIPGALHETTFPFGFMRGTHWIFGE